MKKLLVIVLFLLLPVSVFAASCEEYTAGNWYPGSYAAQSLAIADVQACSDDVALTSGDIIHLKSGTESWTSRLTIADAGVILQGATTTSRNATTYVVTATDNTIIQTNGVSLSTTGIRITGITFDGITTIPITFTGGSMVGARVDHNHFDGCTRVISKNNAIGMLFDNNLVTDPSSEAFYVEGAGNAAFTNGGACGNENPANTTWFEDNEFRWTGTGAGSPIDHGEGARAAWRYNKFTGHADDEWGTDFFETHGHCEGQKDGNDNAGSYCVESSNNKLDAANGSVAKMGHIRGGIFYAYNNALTGNHWSTKAIDFWVQEVGTQCNTSPCAVQQHEDWASGWGFHAVPLSGDAKYTAGLCDTYPCPMQPQDSYVWGNTSADDTFTAGTDEAAYMEEDRDWWDDIGDGDTNFTTGVAASLPGTCTVDDSYFATDTGVLSNCTSTNVWTTIYTAYAYPHPRQNLSSIAVTGTASDGSDETDIAAGTQTLIFTITGDEFVLTMCDDNTITTAFLATLDGSLSGAGNFDDEFESTHANCVRDSATQATLTIKASGYDSSQSETVAIGNMPADALLTSTASIAVSPAYFVISVEAALTAETGRKVSTTGPSGSYSTTGAGMRIK